MRCEKLLKPHGRLVVVEGLKGQLPPHSPSLSDLDQTFSLAGFSSPGVILNSIIITHKAQNELNMVCNVTNGTTEHTLSGNEIENEPVLLVSSVLPIT